MLMIVLCFDLVSTIVFRSGQGSLGIESENDDNETVELEKSNVLLMGSTGSGMIDFVLHFFFVSEGLDFVGLPICGIPKDREDITCKNPCSHRERAIHHC